MDTLGQRLMAARIEVGYRRPEDFSHLVGRSSRQVRDYEKGTVVPPADVVQRWAKATGKPLEYFMPTAEPEAHATIHRSHPGIEALRHLLFGNPKDKITEEELDDLSVGFSHSMLITPGDALDSLLLQRRQSRR